MNIQVEIYRTIVDFPNYEISNFGNVRNKKNEIVNQRINKDGCKRVNLYRRGKYHKLVHRLVCEAFLENSEHKEYVNHIDGNKENNNINNLRWATRQEFCGNAKLSPKNTSGYKGITFENDKWRARITVNGRKISLGSYDNIQDAITARKNKANEIFGEFTNACESN